MSLDELKSTWQQNPTSRSEADIQQTVAKQTDSVFSRTKLKVWIETAVFLLALLVFMTGLDAENKPLWVNGFLCMAAGIGILNNLWLYRSLTVNNRSDDLKTSLQKTRQKLWQQILFAGVFSAVFFGSVFLFLAWRGSYSPEKIGLLLLLLIASIGIRTGMEIWRWRKHIRQLDQSLAELTY
uniref:Uncharacterized protein n=1 Tax=Roseihalotalea indica TaxID=2867963 RepID=A0AA49GTK3_9BACT|nr:hypothetical protein K4G66_07065 [Tunicatimonas sp. TK19036]